MKRIGYSTFCLYAFKSVKKKMACLCEEDWIRLAGKLYPALVAGSGWDKEDAFANRLCFEMMAMCSFMWRYRAIDHYFLSPGLADFFVSCARDESRPYGHVLPIVSRGSIPNTMGKFENGVGAFCIHFPAKEQKGSVIVVVCDHPFFCDGDIVSGIDTTAAIADYISDVDVSVTSLDKLRWDHRLITGFSLYVDAFPGAVVPAKSDDIHDIRNYAGRRHSVTMTDEAKEDIDRSVSPHWRRGHMRLLSSEKFTRKSGQTVFVRGTMVRGRAFDVLDDDPKQQEAMA